MTPNEPRASLDCRRPRSEALLDRALLPPARIPAITSFPRTVVARPMPLLLRYLLVLLAAVGPIGIVSATAACQHQPPPHTASPFLPSSHWAVAAARRLASLDLANPDFGWGDGSLTILAVGRVLHDAPAIAQRKHHELEPLASGYWLQFAREFPLTAATVQQRPARRDADLAEGWVAAGYSAASGRIHPVRSLDRTRENVDGPFPRSDLSEAALSTNLGFTIGRYIAGSLSPEHRDGDWGLREGYALLDVKKIGIWGGRYAPTFATGEGGGIVLNGTASFTGGGLTLTEPIRLPWIFRYIGAIRYETFLSRLDSNATIPRPWFFATHASISPHPRVLIGVTQAFMFGGDGVAPFTWNNFKEMFLTHGLQSAGTEFENGLASGEIRFRPPIPRVPLTLYMEWGADDNHAAWTLFPGRVFGAQIPAVPGIPALSLGLEHAGFSRPCTGCDGCHCEYYATWYRHYLFKDGWTVDRQPIGHPLGGEGGEWLAYGTWHDPASRFRFDARAFRRNRGSYNLYSPDREGHSTGGQVSTVYRASSNVDLLMRGALEDGEAGWRESSIFAGLRWIF